MLTNNWEPTVSTGKIRIKIGAIEIDYEGSESFLKQELPDLLSAVSKLHEAIGLPLKQPFDNGASSKTGGNETSNLAKNAMSVTTIAAKIGAKSGSELLLAAGARLSRSGSLTFTRQALLDEMKLAAGFYKATYRSNFSNYLLTLVKDGKFQETSKDSYSLSMATKNEIEAKLV